MIVACRGGTADIDIAEAACQKSLGAELLCFGVPKTIHFTRSFYSTSFATGVQDLSGLNRSIFVNSLMVLLPRSRS